MEKEGSATYIVHGIRTFRSDLQEVVGPGQFAGQKHTLPVVQVKAAAALPRHLGRGVAQGRAVLAVELEPAAEFLFGQVLVIDRIGSIGLFRTSASREKEY